MDRYQEMRIFQAVVSDLSLAAAARRLNISAPTVTRAMAALEQRLGTPLLQRSTRGVSLTASGERFASDCQRILQDVKEAEASASGLHAEPRGHLHLAMPLLFGQQIMTATLLDYLQAYPHVEMFAQYLDRFPNLHEEGIDVAVLVGALLDSSLFALQVGSIRRVVCASPDYLQRHGTPERPQALSTQQIIHSTADSRLPEWRFQDQGNPLTVSLRPRLTCATNQAAIVAACAASGVIRCMSYQVHELIEQGRLCHLLQAYELPPLPVYLAYREGRKAAARVRSFIDFTVSRLREHPALR